MRIKFSRSKTYTPEFNDNTKLPEAEQIKAVLKVMNFADFLDLADHLQQIGLGNQVDAKDVPVNRMKPLLMNAGHFLSQYVEVTGLIDDETSQPLSVSDIAAIPVFLPLATELLVQLAAVSMPTENDVKN